MTENKNQVGPQSGKPSWFELVDSDAPSAQVVKVNKKLPVIALFVTAAIAASGTFFANASNSSASTPQPMTSTNTTVASTPAATASPDTKNVNALSTTAPKSHKVQNPSLGGVQAPSAGRGDDHDGREGREGHDRGERDHEERDDY